jgi:hypothetical protein
MSVEWKQDGEDWVWIARDRSFGGAIVEMLRVPGTPGALVSIAGNPVVAPVLRATAVLLAAAVKTLHATPVQVLPAPPANTYIEVVSMHAYLKFGSAGYDSVAATDYLELRYTDGSGALLVQAVSPAGFGDATSDAHLLLEPAASWAPANAKVVAYIAGSEWYAAAGDSDLHLDILYRIRPLAF